MMRSPVGVTAVVSVATLLPGAVSSTPTGALIVAVLAITPLADATTLAMTVKDAVPPGSKDTLVLMALPDPPAGHADPAEAAHVHETPLSEAGATSVNGAPTTADGPLFDTTIAYTTA